MLPFSAGNALSKTGSFSSLALGSYEHFSEASGPTHPNELLQLLFSFLKKKKIPSLAQDIIYLLFIFGSVGS